MTEEALMAMRQALLDAGIKNVFIGDLPELQLDAVSLKVAQGYPNSQFFGQHDMLEPLVEILTRAKEYADGATISNLAMETLNKFSDEATGVLCAQVTGSPGYLGRNQKGFGEWHCVLHVTLNNYIKDRS